MSQPQARDFADVEVFRDYFNNSFLLHFDPSKIIKLTKAVILFCGY